jgi:hypothetical protein
MLPGLVLPLAELVEIFPVVYDAANRGIRRGRNFHQVQPLTAGCFEGLERRHDAELLALFVNHTNFFGANPFVDANESVSDKSSLLAPAGQQ